MSLDWDAAGSLLYSGGMDKLLKAWDQNLGCQREVSYLDSVHLLKSVGEDWLAVAGGSSSRNVTVWQAPRLDFPLFTFQGKNKEPVVKFDSDAESRFLVVLARDKDAMPEVIAFEAARERFRFPQGAFAIDQNDNLAFCFKGGFNVLATHNFGQQKEVGEALEFAQQQNKTGIFSVKDEKVAPADFTEAFQDQVFNISKETSLKISKRQPSLRRSRVSFPSENTCNLAPVDYPTIKEQIEFFEQNYQRSQDSVENCLSINALVALESGNPQISRSWNFLRSLFKDYITESLPAKPPKSSLLDTSGALSIEALVKNFIQYFSENEADQLFILPPNSAYLKEDKLVVNKQLEGKLRLKALSEEGVFSASPRTLFSRVAAEVITALIDGGEIIHGFAMYSVLKGLLEVPEKVSLIWETSYIDMLCEQHLEVFAARLVKSSRHRVIRERSLNSTAFNFGCPKCGTEIAGADKGVCPKCKRDIKCGICKKGVKGLMLLCSECNHGGHLNEMVKWFDQSKSDVICPEGCGHRCFSFENSGE